MDGQEETREFDLLLPRSVTGPLWRSLLGNLRDRIFPEKLPPLQLTSRPVNVGMLVGDLLSLPWYRTVFTNLGNVINPETLPPLELESRPADVGELVSDQLAHLWWTSLLRNLADRIAPEQLPALQLTSAPVDAGLKSGPMQLMRWSSLITLPKVPPSQWQYFTPTPSRPGPVRVMTAPVLAGFGGLPPGMLDRPSGEVHPHKLRTALSRSRVREGLLSSVAIAEALYLLASMFGLI